MSNNGKWCRECIEWEWPQISLGDGKHWLVWKVVFEREQEFYFGFLNCPYKVDFISIPWGLSNWFLSPLGALKQIGKMGGKGKCRIIVSVVRISDTFLREDNILESFSPALTLEVFEPEDFSFSPQEATALLDALPYDEKAIAEVEAIEKKFRPEVYGKVELPRKIPLKGKARRIFFDNLCRKLEMEGIEIPYLKGFINVLFSTSFSPSTKLLLELGAKELTTEKSITLQRVIFLVLKEIREYIFFSLEGDEKGEG